MQTRPTLRIVIPQRGRRVLRWQFAALQTVQFPYVQHANKFKENNLKLYIANTLSSTPNNALIAIIYIVSQCRIRMII